MACLSPEARQITSILALILGLLDSIALGLVTLVGVIRNSTGSLFVPVVWFVCFSVFGLFVFC